MKEFAAKGGGRKLFSLRIDPYNPIAVLSAIGLRRGGGVGGKRENGRLSPLSGSISFNSGTYIVSLVIFKVAPAELEALLNTHPAVQDAAVVGLKMGEEVGEVPKAFVVLKPDTDVKPLEIEEFVERKFRWL